MTSSILLPITAHIPRCPSQLSLYSFHILWWILIFIFSISKITISCHGKNYIKIIISTAWSNKLDNETKTHRQRQQYAVYQRKEWGEVEKVKWVNYMMMEGDLEINYTLFYRLNYWRDYGRRFVFEWWEQYNIQTI